MGKIGIFDSGVGGLNTLKALREAMPMRDFHYLGDVARAPYGARGQDELLQFTEEAASYLRAHGCNLVIVACNTASTHAMKVLQEKLSAERSTFRLLGILTPIVECAVATTRNNLIGVIATQSTVDSNKYVREVAKLTNKVKVFQQAAPSLASLIENNAPEFEIRAALREAVPAVLEHKIDTLVLGCTHYGHEEELIQDMLPPSVTLVYEESCIANSLSDYLSRHTDFAQTLSHEGTCIVESTKLTPEFVQFVERAVPHCTPSFTSL